VILGAAYSLWMVKRVIFGEIVHDTVAALKDVNTREFVLLLVLLVCVVVMGVYPAIVTDLIQTSVSDLLKHVVLSKLP
jgi:NADH-quinone oxidoreductase subunit M